MTRVNQFPQNHRHFTFPALITITSAGRAQAVAEALCALPLFPHGGASVDCTLDWGVNYLLSFTSAAGGFQAVTVDASGCEQIEGADPASGQPVGYPPTRWAARSPWFWPLLGAAAGISQPGYQAFAGTMAS